MDRYTGDIAAIRRADGSVRMAVTPGPLRATRLVLEQAEPEVISRAEDLVTFHSVEDDGSRNAYRYRATGEESGPEGGWVLLEPVP